VLTLIELCSLKSFYPYQKTIINAVLDKQDCIVVQSTGNEKKSALEVSTCLPAKKGCCN